MTFFKAFESVLQGKRAKREAWTKECYIEEAKNIYYTNSKGVLVHTEDMFCGKPVLSFVDKHGARIGWVAYQQDLFATDWVVFI